MKPLYSLLGLLFALPVLAEYKGTISLTPQEISKHQTDVSTIVEVAADCLRENFDTHHEWLERYGISRYYGDTSLFGLLSYAEKKDYIKNLGKDVSLLSEMGPTSCVGLARKCLKQGFLAAGAQVTWEKLDARMKANAMDGGVLQEDLRKLGWKVLYWNPDPSKNAAWDADDVARNPTNKSHSWGRHADRYNQVMKTGKYYLNKVDDKKTLVGFGKNVPAVFKAVPFFIGTVHSGYHVFPGFSGTVIEGHSKRLITDPTAIETSPFNPLANGGGPRGKYFSGLMAVPPGYGL